MENPPETQTTRVVLAWGLVALGFACVFRWAVWGGTGWAIIGAVLVLAALPVHPPLTDDEPFPEDPCDV